MRNTFILILFTALLQSTFAYADDSETMLDFNTILKKYSLGDSIRNMSDSTLLEESITLEQATVQAKNRSNFGMELRPSVTDSDVGVGLRIYLPNRWSNKKLHEQLELVAESEQLRVAALEWQELLTVCRDFCNYRMFHKQIDLYDDELKALKPYLAKADRQVQQHQLSVIDRANLYSIYLNLLNNQNKAGIKLIGIEQQLHMALGSKAKLESFSKMATIILPTELEIKDLIIQAQKHRADYQRLEVNSRSLDAAETLARSEDGFHLKYIQPGYEVDYNDGESSWGVSAAFVLPWGNKNPDVAVYKQQKIQTLSSMALQRKVIEERLQVLIDTSYDLEKQIEKSNNVTAPLISQLENDLKQITGGPLNQVCCRMDIRKRILDAKLQNTQAECEREHIAVELAEELGTFAP